VPHSNTEGYLLIDNRASGGGVTEAAIWNCRHCQRGIIPNPSRVRPHGYCRLCDAYICDDCEVIAKTSHEHMPMMKLLDRIERRIYRKQQANLSI
jgi:hypothetical protein